MQRRITILANKSNTYGIANDVEGLLKVFESSEYSVKVCDPLEVPTYSDITIHLEVPVYVWMPWSTTNIFVVNPEWYMDSWDTYMPKFDKIIVKDSVAYKKFSKYPVELIEWARLDTGDTYPRPSLNEFVWVLGASVNKRAYVSALIPLWKETYPKLTITSVTPLDNVNEFPSNVTVIVKSFDNQLDRMLYFGKFKGHICCSRAEGFGYTAAEAELFGAFTIMNSLPPYLENYKDDYSVAFLPTRMENGFDLGASNGALEEALDLAMESFMEYTVEDSMQRTEKNSLRWKTFCKKWNKVLKINSGSRMLPQLPPILHPNNCPKISVVTLIYNRKKFFDLARHNMMISDYPKDKIEWIIVDDSDDPEEQNSDVIVNASQTCSPLTIVYVPLLKKIPVSEKRNMGVNKATAEIILMMDDDDLYPETSFRRRVAWLTKHPWKPKAVSATIIACYDLLKGISAVNAPPMGIPLSQRVSEATLTFYKSWWESKKFPLDVLVGEGEGFITGREQDLLEIPPQQIIVAFSHGKNVSSRRIPSKDDLTPGCFWGFPKEYLEFIHGLAGIKLQTV
jgi:hypothetical protein